jgi:hypothetical protein
MRVISSRGAAGRHDQPRRAAGGKAGPALALHHILAMRPVAAVLAALSLAACTPSIDEQLGQPGIGAAIESYYEAHAWERNAACTLPRIEAIVAVRTVRETEDELVIEVRYRYRPRFGDNMEDMSGRIYCADWATRQFTLAKAGGGLSVVAMSGEQRPAPR